MFSLLPDLWPIGVEGFIVVTLHITLHCIAPHLITPPQAPAGAPPDVWSQLLSCCEACAAQATQQQEAAPAAALQQQQQQQHVEEETLAGSG